MGASYYIGLLTLKEGDTSNIYFKAGKGLLVSFDQLPGYSPVHVIIVSDAAVQLGDYTVELNVGDVLNWCYIQIDTLNDIDQVSQFPLIACTDPKLTEKFIMPELLVNHLVLNFNKSGAMEEVAELLLKKYNLI